MPQKYSLHIGLNNVDQSSYLGDYLGLKNAENDTSYYQSIAAQKGFTTLPLVGQNATSDNLLQSIKTIAAKMKPGDLFFLSYSGHGTRVMDLNGDEPSGYDQALVLYDRLFIDDEFQNCWPLFPEKSNILFVSDSCFNGTVSRLFIQSRSFTESILTGHTFRGIDTAESDPDFQRNYDFYAAIKIPPLNSRPGCSIIHLAACQDNQLADDGPAGTNNGLFTAKFRKVYADGQFRGSYQSFYTALLPGMPSYQTPAWDVAAGADTSDFEQMVLFES